MSSTATSGNAFVRAVDRLNDGMGHFVAWLTFVMVLITAYNAVVRYVGRYLGFNLSSNAYIELQWYLFSLAFLLGAAYTLKQNAHVRVDVLYSRLSERNRAWIDVVGGVIFLIPFCSFVIWVSWPSVRNSWLVLEGSPDPGGLPRYPIKTVILIAFGLLILQSAADIVRRVELLRRRDWGSAPSADGGKSRRGPRL